MNLGLVGNIAKKVIIFGTKNSTTILTVCAVGGVAGTAVATGKAVIEARDTIEAHEMDRELKCETIEQIDGVETDHVIYYRERTMYEKFCLTWKSWVLPVFLGGTTIGCILGMNYIHSSRNLALATAYAMSEEAAKEFKDKVADTIGEKKVKKIENEIVQDHIENNEVNDIIYTPYGEQLMYDDWSGRYFRSGQNEVEKSVNMLNKRMNRKMCMSTVNDLYELLGLPILDVGNKFGWLYELNETDEEDVKVTFHPAMSSHGEACIGVRINPIYLEDKDYD